MKKIVIKLGFLSVVSIVCAIAQAIEFSLPAANEYIVGETQTIQAEADDTLGKIGERYDIGYVEMAEANPKLDPDSKLTEGTEVMIPSRFILPDAPREGIVINVAELRLYYYPAKGKKVYTFPMGIGREGWETPLKTSFISQKQKNPSWYPPLSIRQDAAAQGYSLPAVVPPGPDNPLGRYKMRLGSTTLLIHGTNKPEGVGRRSSAGCMRMFPKDVEFLFNIVPMKTSVHIVNQPYKVVWDNDQLYMEAHMPLQEQQLNDGSDLAPVVSEILRVASHKDYQLDWRKIKATSETTLGTPVVIGRVVK